MKLNRIKAVLEEKVAEPQKGEQQGTASQSYVCIVLHRAICQGKEYGY